MKKESELFAYYDSHLDAGPKDAAIAVGCSSNTASSAKNRWKRARGYAIGTIKHPVRGLVKVKEGTEITAEVSPLGVMSVSEVAAELLNKALEAIHSYNQILGERNSWKSQANESEDARRKAVEEKERILKAHNELVKQVNNGKLPSLDDILSALRRDIKPGQKL